MKRIWKLLIAFIITNAVVISVIVVSHNAQQKKYAAMVDEKERESYISIVVPTKNLYNMVRDIVGDDHDVSYMFKNDHENLNFEYTKDSVTNIGKQDLFLYMGMENEPWVDGFLDLVKRETLTTVNISRGIISLPLTKPRVIKEKEYKENPYYWMNLENYKTALNNIRVAVTEKDTRNRDKYEKNFKLAIEEIDKLEEDLNESLEKVNKYTFVVREDTFDYFLKSKGFKTIKIPEELKKEEWDMTEEKLKSAKDLIFLCGHDNILRENQSIITEFEMKTMYVDVEEYYDSNYEFLQKLVDQFKNFEDK
ncbi:MAG: zinc ABC transporter substrate-binding protein [Clostridium sp.]|uniref:metal ABC transporter substrate-binding protein n=1 Tax=Clostridium sp. TaxID=1506 RepID=UPI002A8832E0|nr:zinc ABC transporter substrate-binding protein [Clostridium sp.]MDY5099014.1 zinc ABC transporter substrate-binding protein [Clostridium sp.]